MVKHNQYCLGTAETQEKGKGEFRGSHLPLWCFYAVWGFGKDHWYFFELLKGITPKDLPEQKLQRIVKLSANSKSQQEVARTLGVSQRCIRKTGRHHQRTRGGSMKNSTPREDHKLLRMKTASSGLLVCECRWSADLGGGCQFEPFETASGCRILVSASRQMP